jgi:hypothetical protein
MVVVNLLGGQGFGAPRSSTKIQPNKVGRASWNLPKICSARAKMPDAKFSFLFPEALEIMQRAGKFYLWDGKFFGEATLTPYPNGN